MANINKLLSKKGWTGRELGIIDLTNMATMFAQALRGEPRKPIIEDSQLRKMVSELKDSTQGRIFNGYVAMHEWLAVKYNVALTQFQQAQLQFRTIEGFITEAIITEDTFRYAESLPVIMTQEQYDKLKKRRIEEAVTGEEGQEIYADYADLIAHAVEFYIEKLRREPRRKNPLKDIKKKYKTELVTSPYILENWNSLEDIGYYVLEDGQRSDRMSDEEWQEAITTPKMKELLNAMRAETPEGEELTLRMAQERLERRAAVVFKGGSEKEAEISYRESLHDQGLVKRAEWHISEEAPKDLTKWEFISKGYLGDIYFAMPETEEEYISYYEDFRNEFSDLIKASCEAIDKDYPHLLSEGRLSDALEAPTTAWIENLISYRDLYKMDFYGMKREFEGDSWIFDGDLKAFLNGISIIRPHDRMNRGSRIDEEGNYVEPDMKPTLENYSLEGFFSEAEDFAINVSIMESSRQMLLDSYYFLLSYNHSVRMIAKLHDVPEVAAFLVDIDEITKRIDIVNSLTPVLFKRIQDTIYTDTELKARKLRVLVDYFQPIDYKSVQIPTETREVMDAMIADFTAFRGDESYTFYDLMLTRPEGMGEGE